MFKQHQKFQSFLSGLALSLSMIFSQNIHAAVFTSDETYNSPKRLSEVMEIILDVENTCQTGCKYKLNNIREGKIIQKENDNLYYTWIYINSTKDSQEFTEVKINKISDQEYVIESKTPDRETIKKLRESTKYNHDSFFDRIESKWTLKEVLGEAGEFKHTEISYENKAVAGGLAAKMFSGLIKKEIRASTNQMFENFK